MYLKRMIALFFAAVMLTACADVPEEVKSSAERESSSASIAENSATPAESTAENPADKITSAEYDNIKFADTFTVNCGDPDGLGVYEAERRTDLTAHADEIFSAFFGSNYDSAKVTTAETDTALGKEADISFEHGGTELHINGRYLYFVNRNEDGKNLYFTNSDKLEALYEVAESTQNERITLAEGEASVGELAGKLEGFLEKLKSAGLGEFHPFTVASLTNKDQGRTLPTTEVIYRKYFKGLPIFNFAFVPQNSESPELNYLLIESDAVSFASRGSIFSGGFSSAYTEVRKVEAADSIISPEQAVETASRSLAEYLDLTALRLDLVYVPVVPEGAADNSKVTFYPYWLLAFGLQPLAENYALINAVSGEVIYYDPKGV